MGWESSDVVRFDVGPLLQDQTMVHWLLLCQLTCPREQLLQNYLEACCFFKKIPYLSRMKICSRHANLSVRLFARAITREVPPPKV